MELNYKIQASINPTQGTSGSTVRMNAVLTDIEGEIAGVYATVVGEGMQFRLNPVEGDTGKYSAATTIPWGAPPGTYSVSVYAVDSERQKGETVTLQFRVT